MKLKNLINYFLLKLNMSVVSYSDYEGWKSVMGGFMIHLVLGTLYLWGNITPYVTSHLRKYDANITYGQTILVFAAAIGVQGISMVLGGVIESNLGARNCCLFGGSIIVIGTFLSSFAVTLKEVLFCNGILFGMGMGVCYAAPIACASRWMPGNVLYSKYISFTHTLYNKYIINICIV